MRFLFLTQYYKPEVGAAQIRLAAVAQCLSARGHQVEVVTGMPNYPNGTVTDGYRRRLVAHDDVDGIPVQRTWLFAAMGSGLKRAANYASFTATSLPAMASRRRPDVVVVESPPPTLAVTGWLMARMWRVPMILNVADMWPDSAVQLGLIRQGRIASVAARLEAWAYRHATLVTAVTEGIRTALIERKGVPSERILFLPNGVDTDAFRPVARDDALAARLGLQGRRVILGAGTMIYAAGLDVVIAAAERLRDRPITFLLVGGGSERDRMRSLVAQHRLDNVLLLDSRPAAEIPALYSIADAGLMTLRDAPLFEGTRPARILAAMACAKPVIYSGAGEGARMIIDADAGVVTRPEDPDALADAVRAMIDDPARAAAMGANGRAYVEAHLDWDHLVGDWLAQLDHAVSGAYAHGGV